MAKEDVLGTLISTGSYQQMLEAIAALPGQQRSSYVCFVNVHMVMEAHQDEAFQKVVNEADIAAPDGRPVSLFLNRFRGMNQERVCGMDVLPDLLKRAAASGQSVYFYGTTDTVLQAIREKASRELPNLQIKGMYAPPFRVLTSAEKAEVIQQINKAAPDFLFVALGCPKQEKWMAEHRGQIFACMLGVGQAFYTYAGLEKRLPQWMRNLSLEWLYRLTIEPKRLWKRYLTTNSKFVWLTMKYALTRKA